MASWINFFESMKVGDKSILITGTLRRGNRCQSQTIAAAGNQIQHKKKFIFASSYGGVLEA